MRLYGNGYTECVIRVWESRTWVSDDDEPEHGHWEVKWDETQLPIKVPANGSIPIPRKWSLDDLLERSTLKDAVVRGHVRIEE
jgi:hypothetical protein